MLIGNKGDRGGGFNIQKLWDTEIYCRSVETVVLRSYVTYATVSGASRPLKMNVAFILNQKYASVI